MNDKMTINKKRSCENYIPIEKKRQSWLMNILVAGDQLGNALSKGNPDNTISARIGYFNYAVDSFNNKYWKLLERIVNFTFKPIDGPDHCFQAYCNDRNEDFEDIDYTSDGILFFFVVIPCIPLFVFVRIAALVYPKVKSEFAIREIDLTFKEACAIKKMRMDERKTT